MDACRGFCNKEPIDPNSRRGKPCLPTCPPNPIPFCRSLALPGLKGSGAVPETSAHAGKSCSRSLCASCSPGLPGFFSSRFELLMTWTLPEIHCDDMHLSGLRKQGKEWLATYRFVVYATQGSEASPVIRARLKRRFPECGELLFQTGKACTVEERVRFIPVQQYGLVPEKVVLDHPELLSQM